VAIGNPALRLRHMTRFPRPRPEPDIVPIEIDPAPSSMLGRPRLRALVGCEGDLGRLPIRGVDQPSRHQQQYRKDQGIDHGDRDHAHGEAAEMIVEVRAQHIAQARDDGNKRTGHHQQSALQASRAGADRQVQKGGRGDAAHKADRRRRDQGARHRADEQQRDKLRYRGHRKARNKAFGPPPKKMAVFTLVEREGEARSRHVANVDSKTLREEIVTQTSRKSYLMTDEALVYERLGREFAGHGTVNHSADEYVRTGGFHHTNTVESFFALLKRAVFGQFHHISEVHLHRYLAEADFKYNHRSALGIEDAERADALLRGVKGKRLLYRQPNQAPNA
jgi:hypothetical protein